MTELDVEYLWDDSEGRLAARIAEALLALISEAEKAGVFDPLFLKKECVQLGIDELGRQESSLPLLLKHGLITQDEQHFIRSEVMLHRNPHIGLVESHVLDFRLPASASPVWIATDWPDVPLRQESPFAGRDMVFPLHYESFALIEQFCDRIDRRRSINRVLDMCSGSGVLGIYAARLGAQQVDLVDVSRRALTFSRINACMSGCFSALKFHESDLFEAASLAGSQWNAILANPPFEPIQEGAAYYSHSHGGHDGQAMVRKILQAAPRNLAPDGFLLMVDFLLGDKDQGFEIMAAKNKLMMEDLLGSSGKGKLRFIAEEYLRDFWCRYLFLGVDRNGEQLRELHKKGKVRLFLCTLRLDSKFITNEQDYSAKGSPVCWINPLHWPLPCGIPLSKQSLDHWFEVGKSWEQNKISNDATILAERICSKDGKITFWNLADAIKLKDPHKSSDGFASIPSLSLYFQETLRHAQELQLLGVTRSQAVEFLLLPDPQSASTNTSATWIRTSPRWNKLFKRGADPLLVNHFFVGEINSNLHHWLTTPGVLVRFFVLAAQVANIDGKGEHEEILDYHELAGTQTWMTGTQGDNIPTLSDIIQSKDNEAQGYLFWFRLSPRNLALITSSTQIWGAASGRIEQLNEQLFRFIRGRIPILAIASEAVQREEARLAREQMTLAAMSAHLLRSEIGRIHYQLAWDSSPQANAIRESLWIMELYRDAVTISNFTCKIMDAGCLHEVIDKARRIDTKFNWNQRLKTGKYRVMESYLRVLMELCLQNIKDYSMENCVNAKWVHDSDRLYLELDNEITKERCQPLQEILPELNAGTANRLGVNTLHLVCRRAHGTPPAFSMHTQGEKYFFRARLPIAEYDSNQDTPSR